MFQKVTTAQPTAKSGLTAMVDETMPHFVSGLQDYTDSLEVEATRYRFIHYHEDEMVSITSEHRDTIYLILQRLAEIIVENRSSIEQVLIHSRVKDDQLLLKLQVPDIAESRLTDMISNTELDPDQIELLKGPRHHTIKIALPIIKDLSHVSKVSTVSRKTRLTPAPHDLIALDTDERAILIIEDNEEIAKFIGSCIPYKYKTFISSDGRAGVTQAFHVIPDLIISDIMMPQLDGLELCDLLKNDIRTEHIPIILLTAKVTDQDKIAGFKHGADAYITKPFDETELQLRIENLMRLRDNIRKNQSISPQKKPASNELFRSALLKQLELHYTNEEYGVQQLAESLNMSRMQLHRKVKTTLNLTTSEVMNEYRLDKAAAMIKGTEKRVSEIAYEVGFADAGYFSKLFRSKYGISPSQIRET